MTKEEISRLGKPYYSTKAEGTGLGMLMVYSTIDKVKGIVEVDSEKAKAQRSLSPFQHKGKLQSVSFAVYPH